MHSILFIFALRMFFYGLMTSPWQVIFIEWTNGLIVGLFYPAMTLISFQIAPENLTTTTTSVAYFMEGLGMYIREIGYLTDSKKSRNNYHSTTYGVDLWKNFLEKFKNQTSSCLQNLCNF